jgi:hypothetical protein
MDDDVGSGTPPAHVPPSVCAGFGLSFSGSSFDDTYYFSTSDDWRGVYGYNSPPAPIARGGVESIGVSGYKWVALNQWTPFDAVVNGDALSIDEPGPFMLGVTVTGAAPGVADLCIYDVGADTVRDGVRLLVADVDTVFASPSNRFYEATSDVYPFAKWLLHTGSKRELVFGMESAEHWRLADTMMNLELSLNDAPFINATQGTWDSIVFDAADAGTARMRATLSSGVQLEARADVVDRVDQLVRTSSWYDSLANMQVGGGWGNECFETYRNGVRVYGSPFTFTASSNVVVQTSSSRPNCISLDPIEPGTGVLVVTVDDQALELPYAVKPATGS